MTQPIGFAPSALLFALTMNSLAAEPIGSPAASAGKTQDVAKPAVPAADPGIAPPPVSNPPPIAGLAPVARKLNRPPAALKHLSFSAREGFSLRMVSNQDVTAEIRNGAGRTIARTAYNLEPGEWTLRPRNLAPGLYTVLLRTGAQLRSLRMKIEDIERGKGQPEWVLERVQDSLRVTDPAAPRGAFVYPAPD